MARVLSPTTKTGVVATVSRPFYLVEIDFATPLRLSSRETVTYSGFTFTAATVEVDLAGRTLKIYNGDLAHTANFISRADGALVRIWVCYGDTVPPWGDADLFFDGECGAVGVGEWITVKLRDSSAKMIPSLFVAPPSFRHLPPDGVEFLTPSGVFKLTRGQ